MRVVHGWTRVQPLRQLFLANPDRYLSIIDQGMVAVCRFAAVVIFARLLSHDEFGIVSLAISVSILFVGFARASFTLPFAAFCADRKELAEGGARWFAFILFLVVMAFILSSLAGLLLYAVGSPSWVVRTAVYSAILGPATLLYEMSRRWLLQLQRYRSLIVQGVLCTAVSIISFLGVFVLRYTWAAILSLTLAYVVAAVAALSRNLPPTRAQLNDIPRVWRDIRHFTRWTIIEFVADSMQSYGMNLAVAFFGGPASASIFVATRNVVAPAYTLISALGGEMPRLARAYASSGRRGLTKALRSTQASMLIVCAPYLLAVAFFSDSLLRVLYGAKYSNLATELRLWAVAALLLAIIRPLDMWLLASQDSRTLFMRKMLGAIATILVAAFLLPTRGVEGALYAIVAGMTVNIGGLLIAVYWPQVEPRRDRAEVPGEIAVKE